MSPRALAPAPLSELPLEELWQAQIRRWQRRLPRGYALGTAEDIFIALQGELWLECLGLELTLVTATKALRRVLYREHEVAWQHSAFPLAQALPFLCAAAPLPLELPEHALPFAEAYLQGQGSEGSLRRAMPHFGSRRKVRCLNTLLLQHLTDGAPLQNLKRRAARLMASVARDGITKVHAQEARYLRRALRMLDPCAEIVPLLDCLRPILRAESSARAD